MADSIQQQLAERRRRESQRHRDSSNQNQNQNSTMEQESQSERQPLGSQTSSADRETVDAVEVFGRINKHKSNLRKLNQRKEEIEKQIVNEARALARQEEILNRIVNQATLPSNVNGNDNHNHHNNDEKKNDDDVIMGNNVGNTNDNSNEIESRSEIRASTSNARVMTQEDKDREIALQMQREYEYQQEQQQGEEAPPRQRLNNNGFHQSFVFRSDSNGGSTFHFSSNIGNPNMNNNHANLGSSFFGNLDPMMGMRGFGGNGSSGNGLGSGNDIFSQLDSMNSMAFMGMNDAVLRLGGMNGFAFGGGINPDNMSYDQLVQMFPNVPRGANETAIQALPTDEYKAPPSNDASGNDNNENKNENESKSNDNKKNENTTKSESCSICLEEFKNGESIRRLPCLHIFHTDEIDR